MLLPILGALGNATRHVHNLPEKHFEDHYYYIQPYLYSFLLYNVHALLPRILNCLFYLVNRAFLLSVPSGYLELRAAARFEHGIFMIINQTYTLWYILVWLGIYLLYCSCAYI